MTSAFVTEATTLATKTYLNKAETRRFAFLIATIAEERAAELRAATPPTINKEEERRRMLASLQDLGIKSGHREKVLKILRPDLALSY